MSICQKGEIKERAIGGIITGIKRELTEEEEEDEKEETEGIQMRKITLDKEKRRIVTTYNRRGIKEIMRKIKEILPEEKEGNLVLSGDFNIRIGTEGTIVWGDDKDEIGRK